jgi:hypothetical protein
VETGRYLEKTPTASLRRPVSTPGVLDLSL